MSDGLRQLWGANPETMRAAGRELTAIGRLLADGRIDEAISRVEALGVAYPEWVELERATADLEAASAAQAREDAAREAILSLVGKGLAAILRGAVGL